VDISEVVTSLKRNAQAVDLYQCVNDFSWISSKVLALWTKTEFSRWTTYIDLLYFSLNAIHWYAIEELSVRLAASVVLEWDWNRFKRWALNQAIDNSRVKRWWGSYWKMVIPYQVGFLWRFSDITDHGWVYRSIEETNIFLRTRTQKNEEVTQLTQRLG